MENANITTETFIFYRSFYEAIREFDDKDRLALYDSIVNFAFENKETEFTGMKNVFYKMAIPQLEASIKNYKIGRKGGRPRNPQPQIQSQSEEIQEESETFYTGIVKDVEDFITDYREHKAPDFEPTPKEREKIEIILNDLGKYDKDYWVKVFQMAKGGYLINDKIVPCSLLKILLEHNKIFRGEANLQPNKELAEKRRQAQKKQKELEQKEVKAEVEAELEERNQARIGIKTALDAVNYLNTYVKTGVMLRQISADYKELKAIYPEIALNKEGVYYVQE